MADTCYPIIQESFEIFLIRSQGDQIGRIFAYI
jgi:hypothetical protein